MTLGNPIARITRRGAAAAMIASAAVWLVACGGGGDAGTTATPSAGTDRATAYTAGPITGFGSVIVNGVRFDDSTATVVDDDDNGHGRDRLRLGMMVEVDSAAIDRGLGLGRALRIRFGSEIVGPVDAIDAAAGTLTVFGQPVVVNADTIVDDGLAGGLAGVAVGTVLEVYARFDAATGVYTATRIEAKPNALMFKVRGRIASLDTAATTFQLGGRTLNYGNVPAAQRPNALANGMPVVVLVAKAPVAGQWIAIRLRSALKAPDDRAEAHVRGSVTAFTSLADFAVNGLPVNAANARFPDGSAGIVLGADVSVEGAVVNGVLVATQVEIDDGRHADRFRLELHGAISGLDTTAKTFVLRGVTVAYDRVQRWDDGSEADLANGRRVEVKGVPSADRTRLVATRIEFE